MAENTGIEIKIVIPSAGRAETITTHHHFKNSIICVPEDEERAYRIHCPDTEIVVHPKIAGLGMKRQWILDKFGHTMMIDDDCKGFSRIYVTDAKKANVDRETAYEIIQWTGNMAHLAGMYLFGFSKWNNPMRCDGLQPIKMKGLVFGQCMGVLAGSGIKFHPHVKCNNDVYFSLMNAYRHRMAWIDERFAAKFDGYGNNNGGLSSYRSEEVEKADFDFLKRNFGDAVEIKRGTWASRLKKSFEKQVRLPF